MNANSFSVPKLHRLKLSYILKIAQNWRFNIFQTSRLQFWVREIQQVLILRTKSPLMPGGERDEGIYRYFASRTSFGLILTVDLCRMSIYTYIHVKGALFVLACAKRGLTELPAKVLLVDRAHSRGFVNVQGLAFNSACTLRNSHSMNHAPRYTALWYFFRNSLMSSRRKPLLVQ